MLPQQVIDDWGLGRAVEVPGEDYRDLVGAASPLTAALFTAASPLTAALFLSAPLCVLVDRLQTRTIPTATSHLSGQRFRPTPTATRVSAGQHAVVDVSRQANIVVALYQYFDPAKYRENEMSLQEPYEGGQRMIEKVSIGNQQDLVRESLMLQH